MIAALSTAQFYEKISSGTWLAHNFALRAVSEFFQEKFNHGVMESSGPRER
jgi:hypothetical protein